MEEWFRFFIRKNYPKAAGFSNNILDELSEEFDKYLRSKLNEYQLKTILPESIMDIIKNMDHPLKRNGFHPALFIHFDDFLKAKIKENG